MQRAEFLTLITQLLTGGYQSDAYREYLNLSFRKLFSVENFQDMLSLMQAELKKPHLKNTALVWDLYLSAREGIKPLHPSNIISLTSGMLYQSRVAYCLRALYFLHRVNRQGDHARAYELFLQARELGHITANYYLGFMEKFGLGREVNRTKARYYFEQAAEKQCPYAFHELGLFAQHGRAGFKQDREQALAFFKTGAALGDSTAVEAIYNLAREMYPRAEDGVDTDKAIPLYTIACEYDHPEALTTLGYIYETQNNFLTAKSLYERASQFNQKAALNNLAEMYKNGKGVEKNVAQAIHYYKRSAKAGNNNAYFFIADLYLEQDAGPQDEKAVKYLEKGVTKNELNCITRLAYYLYHGTHGVQQNVTRSGELYLQGVRLGSTQCRFNLAYLRLKGHINTITEETAWRLLNYAVATNYPMACFFRAYLYEQANQYELAAKFYRKGFVNRGENEFNDIKRLFSQAASGTVLQRYHWYMTEATEMLPVAIRQLYHRHPWQIIQAILSDDLIEANEIIQYLKQLPGTFLQHIKYLSVIHPLREYLENVYKYCELAAIFDYYYGTIQQSQLLDKLDQLATVVNDGRLPAYLTITVLFDAILKDWIDELEIPRALARLYQCHKTIMRLDHAVAAQNILSDHAHPSYMSLDAYLHLFSAHMQLIEAYVTILQQEMALIELYLSNKQCHALVSPLGILMLTDDLLALNQPHVHQEHLSKFSDHIKAINTPSLWKGLKKEKQDDHPQRQLSRALRFFNVKQDQDVGQKAQADVHVLYRTVA